MCQLRGTPRETSSFCRRFGTTFNLQMRTPLAALPTSSPSFPGFHTPVHFPLHRGPLPPPLTPSLSFRVSPTSFTLESSEPDTSTTVVLVVVCEVGEDVSTTRYCFEARSEVAQSPVNSEATDPRNAKGSSLRWTWAENLSSFTWVTDWSNSSLQSRSTVIRDRRLAFLPLCVPRPLAKLDQELEAPRS